MMPGVVAESDLAGTLKSEYVFFDGERVARRDGATGTSGVFYYFSDHLKTASVITDSAGVIKAESDYYPWGGELQFVNNDSNDYKFTGKKRDTETGLDYFGARYYSNGLGRWVSADWSPAPVPVPYANFGDPQSLNLYGYVRNVPTTNVDPDGHDCPVCDLDQEVRDLVQSLQHLTPAAAPAVATVPAAVPAVVLGGPSLIGMGAAVLGPKLEPSDAEGCLCPDNTMYMWSGQEGQGQGQTQETEHTPDPTPASDGAQKGGGKKGGENADTKLGRDKHAEFFEKAKAKGWQVEPSLTDPQTGKQVKPDTVTPAGRPVELKPRTRSARARGKTQIKKYERTTGKKGRVIYYDK